ncbi:PREDICTED: kinesin-like protein KIF23 [Acropora digitifera]|uniref:kinesin-like protein KIF23 n=1 Tax=Acropora digitifera TaxID=70779 RepID=UPI00077A7795|nr:PREDICTED: kinesin-like protein KIF23 [Acropora digitifera]
METDTVLQPSLKNKKTVSRPEGKDFKDTKGEVYKTASGGHSIQFTEVETLKTRSDQLSSPGRKRRGSDSADDDSRSSWTDIETRCSTAIEGRPGLDPSYCHTASKKKRP